MPKPKVVQGPFCQESIYEGERVWDLDNGQKKDTLHVNCAIKLHEYIAGEDK